ncbi:hypothetical protein ACU5AX_01565 [Sphingomonas sp. XXL09]|uniref:hypothetical protein n=1 Tax=Sphingomonas sp. XXL09 TaxID=3457787 RepID=UPI00406BCD35
MMTMIENSTHIPLPIAEMADQLDEMVADLELRFRGVGETLAQAIETIDRMGADLDDIQASLAPEVVGTAIKRLRNAAHRLKTLPAAQERRAAEIQVLTCRTREMRSLLADVGEILHLLGIYGMSIKIASSGETAFFNFVAGMEGKLESGRRELRYFGDELDRFGKVIADMRQADHLLAVESRKIGPEAPAELTSNADALEVQLKTVARMAQDVSGVMRTVQAEVARMLGAIQIGDSVRQRVEHGATILRMLLQQGDDAAPPPTVVATMAALVAAQMRATAQDFSREIGALIAAIEQLGPLTTRLLGLVERQGASGDDGDVLVRIEHGIADVSQVTGQLCEADRRLATLAQFVRRTFADLLGGLSRIQRIALDVQDISTNTRLLCRRHGTTGRAVAVIATEVAPCASRLDASSAGVARLIADLKRVELTQAQGDGEEGRDDLALDAALKVVRQACAKSDRAVSDGGGEARAIVTSLERSADTLHEQRVVVEALERAADLLTGVPVPEERSADEEEALRAVLVRAASLYTMAREREVHAPFLLPGMAVVDADAALEDDDGLF